MLLSKPCYGCGSVYRKAAMRIVVCERQMYPPKTWSIHYCRSCKPLYDRIVITPHGDKRYYRVMRCDEHGNVSGVDNVVKMS